MGFRVLLIAISGKDTTLVREEFGCVATGEFEEIPESPVTETRLPNGAHLLYVHDRLPDDGVLGRLSRRASLLVCYADETAMNSLAASWQDGVEEWAVYHDAQQGIRHLETEGDLPDQFQEIHDRLTAEQDNFDDADCIFEIPVELFTALGGMRYNEDVPNPDAPAWQILTQLD